MVLANASTATSWLESWPLDLNFTLLAGAVVFCALFLLILVFKGAPSLDAMQIAGAPSMPGAPNTPTHPSLRPRESSFVDPHILPGIIWVSEAGPEDRRFNQRWSDLTGRSAEGSSEGRWLDSVHPDDREEFIELLQRKMEANEPISVVYRLRRADGEYRWICEVGTPHRDGIAAANGMAGIAIDVTERHEQAIEWREEVSKLTEQNMRLLTQLAELNEKRSELEATLRQHRLESASRKGADASSLMSAFGQDEVVEAGEGMRQQRVYARLPVEELGCNLGDIQNVSLGGLAINTTKVPEGVVDVVIEPRDEEPIKVKGEVVWSKKAGFRRYEVGLRFLNLSDQSAERLTALATLHRYRRVMTDASGP